MKPPPLSTFQAAFLGALALFGFENALLSIVPKPLLHAFIENVRGGYQAGAIFYALALVAVVALWWHRKR